MALTLSKKSFYGFKKRSKAVDIKAKIERCVLEHKRQPLPRKYKQGLHLSTLWKVFYKQEDAFCYMRKCPNEDLHVFSFESRVFFEQHGQRLYLVTTYDQFWHYYSQLPAEKRHYYEVIPEGAVYQLYFDLEFSRVFNPESNAVRMVETFIKAIQFYLRKDFRIICPRTHILQLDSSTDVKFSQHLIIRSPEVVFTGNINAGCFVRKICCYLQAIVEDKDSSDNGTDHKNFCEDCNISVQNIQELFVLNKNDSKSIFCDTGVYTKNRNFRLYLSSKLNKNTPLRLANENQYPSFSSSDSDDIDHKTIFFHSLVANVQYKASLNILMYEDSQCVNSRRNGLNRNTLSHGSIRRWTYFHRGELLVYDISHNRWCHKIGRQHKSNNIMLLVDIRRGVYYQKCHDPDCKAVDFKSEEWKLPENTLPAFYVQDEVFSTGFDSPSEHRHKGNGVGCLTDNDFNKYFDSDDQDLLEAMTKYEVDVNVQPEWFYEDPFEIEHDSWTRTNLTPTIPDDSGLVGDNQSSTSTKSDKLADLDESYVDPSWFDGDFDQT